MKIGVHLPQWGPLATRTGLIDVAQAVEGIGLDSVWVADHVVFPISSNSRYPYRADGVPFRPEDGFLEALTALAVVAGATERVELGTSVLVLPMRDPLMTAKVVATIDVLSGGRVVLALGAGWWEEEFRALGQQFEGRGRRFDEQIDIMRRAWSQETFAYTGEFYSFEELACTPLPTRPGGPPVLIGGLGKAALRRALTLGDGWHAVGGTVQELAETWRTAQKDVAAEARPRLLSTSTGMPTDPDRAAQRLVDFRDAGFDNVVLNADAAAVTDFVKLLERWDRDVFQALR
jgi:probable F420-dependent oxidoreductase